VNIDKYPEFLPAARQTLMAYLKMARDLPLTTPDPPNYWKSFNYTPEAFDSRMNEIYQLIITDAMSYDPVKDPNFKTRDQVIERVLQMAPFNLMDGAWISHCCPAGPIDEVHSLLWGILTDEMGDGVVAYNHCLLYQQLLNSVGIYLPPVNSRAFTQNRDLLDSAFVQPAYSSLLPLFSQEFFPELLGTTCRSNGQ
jgi:hypothetical protein